MAAKSTTTSADNLIAQRVEELQREIDALDRSDSSSRKTISAKQALIADNATKRTTAKAEIARLTGTAPATTRTKIVNTARNVASQVATSRDTAGLKRAGTIIGWTATLVIIGLFVGLFVQWLFGLIPIFSDWKALALWACLVGFTLIGLNTGIGNANNNYPRTTTQ